MKTFEEGIDTLKDVGSWDLCENRNISVSEDGLPITEVSEEVNIVKNFASGVTPTEDTPLDREDQLKSIVELPNLTAVKRDVLRIKKLSEKIYEDAIFKYMRTLSAG